MDRTDSGLRAGLSPWLTDIAAAESESSHTSKEGRKVLVVAAAAPPFSVVVGMGNIGFRRSRERGEERGGRGNDKKDLQKRINFKRGERERVS